MVASNRNKFYVVKRVEGHTKSAGVRPWVCEEVGTRLLWKRESEMAAAG